jgi:hypothetical protein
MRSIQLSERSDLEVIALFGGVLMASEQRPFLSIGKLGGNISESTEASSRTHARVSCFFFRRERARNESARVQLSLLGH